VDNLPLSEKHVGHIRVALFHGTNHSLNLQKQFAAHANDAGHPIDQAATLLENRPDIVLLPSL
jgi:hypothetical protein